jgi:hypothetical protein
VTQKVTEGLAAMGVDTSGQSGSIPDLGSLPAPVRALYETAFGEATGHLFLTAAPFALLALVCVLFIKEVPLRTTLDRELPQNASMEQSVETSGLSEAVLR